MPSIDVWKLVDDRIQPVQIKPTPDTFDEAFARLPGGAYTTFRTYSGNQALGLDAHLRRLEESAQLTQVPVKVPKGKIRHGLRTAIASTGDGDHRIRILLDLEVNPGDVYLLLEPLRTPSEADYQNGIRLVTCRMQRNNPRAKSTYFIRASAQIRKTLPRDAYEALMVDKENRLLECLTSNFFAVIDGEIWTANEGVLFGITRSIVLNLAKKFDVRVRLDAVTIDEVSQIDEAFITSSSRGVLPVSQIDQSRIGTEIPGPVTKKLMAAYEEKINQMIEPI